MKKSKVPFFIIKSKYSLERFSRLLEEVNFYQHSSNAEIFLLLGYKTLSLESKETYYIIKNLSLQSHRGKKKATVSFAEVTLEYLALVCDTTIEAQSARIQQLIKHQLIQVERTSNRYNRYYVLDPVVDSTFVHTVIQIVRRKRLGVLSYQLSSSKSTKEKVQILQKIHEYHNNGVKHFRTGNIKDMG